MNQGCLNVAFRAGADGAAAQRKFLTLSVTPEGMPRLRFRVRDRTPARVFFSSAKPGEGNTQKSAHDQQKEEKKPETKPPEKSEGDGGFANRCIVEMYASSAFRRSGAYAIA